MKNIELKFSVARTGGHFDACGNIFAVLLVIDADSVKCAVDSFKIYFVTQSVNVGGAVLREGKRFCRPVEGRFAGEFETGFSREQFLSNVVDFLKSRLGDF